MVTHRLRRWPNINPTLGERIVIAGLLLLLYIIIKITFYIDHDVRFTN